MYTDFYTDTSKFYILSSGLTTPLAPRFRTWVYAHIAVTEKFLYGKGFVYVPAFFLTCQFVLPAVFLRKVPLPFEFLAAWRIFWVKGIGKAYGSESFVQILLVNFFDFINLFFQVLLDRLYVFDSGRFSWNPFSELRYRFCFLFWTGTLFFFSQERLFFLKKKPEVVFFLELVLTTWGLICVRLLLY